MKAIRREVIACSRCPRLRAHCEAVARVKRRAYLDQDYWGRPVPSFGDPRAALLIVGLAPGAHGANRTGRMFTGDSSGDLLYAVLHAAGFASQAESTGPGDGLQLVDACITAAARCAPPGNKPLTDELRNCRVWLAREVDAMERVKVVVALGRIAFDAYLSVLREQGALPPRGAFVFAHNRLQPQVPGRPALIASYHPSRQNTSTGRLTRTMLEEVFTQARRLIDNNG